MIITDFRTDKYVDETVLVICNTNTIRLKDVDPTSTLFDRQYSYNAANQISQIVEPDRTRTFGYDTVDRLTSATDSQYGNEFYTYDAVGNRTSSHRSATYGYQPYNRLTSAGSVTYEYGANGVLGSMYGPGYGSGAYDWDYENRLTFMMNESLDMVTNTYDALGRRVTENMSSRIHSDDNFNYTYDGQDVLREDRLGSITKYQNGPGIDNKISQNNWAGTQYFIQDHLGSTTGLADSSGDLTVRISYDSFGNVPGGIYDQDALRYLFTGREYLSLFGLQYSRARWYDPNLGRFISEDPIGFAGGDINLYGYVWSNPLNFTDPTGLDGWGNDAADWLDSNIDYGRAAYKADPAYWGWNGTVDTIGDLSSMAIDPLRVGSGFGYAIYDPDASAWQRAGGIGGDILRGLAIGGVAGRALGGAVSALAKLGRAGEGLDYCPIFKSTPNPYGKLGGPEHQAVVRQVADDVAARGLRPKIEYKVTTPDGVKPTRFADVAGLDAQGNPVEFHQVGRQTKKGFPVSRERQAIRDIRNATGINPNFHPYN